MAKKKLVPGAKKFAALFALRLLRALKIDSSGMENVLQTHIVAYI